MSRNTNPQSAFASDRLWFSVKTLSHAISSRQIDMVAHVTSRTI
jgi:hypothetical protein